MRWIIGCTAGVFLKMVNNMIVNGPSNAWKKRGVKKSNTVVLHSGIGNLLTHYN
jgi:hypothetical protein